MKTNKNCIKVAEKYRKHPLSFEPGGVRLAVILKNGFKLVYNRIKYPYAYARKIHGDDVSEVIILPN
jgi:hypothetical protein